MTRWFRVYDDLVDDEKVQMLSGDLVKALLNLWCLASKNGGVLPPMKAMSFKLRMKPQQVAAVIAELCEAGLIDRVDDLFQPHNWEKRQYKSDTDLTAAERSRRYREKHRDGNAPVTRDGDASRHASASVSVSDSVSVSVSKKEKASSDFEFEDFWNLWPNKVGKPAALKAFVAARKRAGLDAIVEGVFAYIRDKPPDRAWLNPATFLNQDRWKDQPAKVEHGRSSIQETQSLSHIARRHAAEGISFGERPASPSARLDAGIPNVRLLSQGGSERSGDLRGGNGVSPERISAGSDRLHHGPEDGAAEQITVVAERVRG
jgi:hypothetical protein